LPLIQCVDCGRDFSDRAPACPGCGGPIHPGPEEATARRVEPPITLARGTRAGVNQAKYSEQTSSVLGFQVFVIAIVAGVVTESWWVFGTTLLGLMVLLFIPKVRTLAAVGIGFGTAWGIFAGTQALGLGPGASWAITLFGGMAAIGANLSGLDWIADIQEENG